MYVLGLTTAFFLIKTRAARRKVDLPLNDLHDLILYSAIGVILGGRLGYTLFYNLFYYLEHPAKILAVWEGGMSFHGGLIGLIVGFFVLLVQILCILMLLLGRVLLWYLQRNAET